MSLRNSNISPKTFIKNKYEINDEEVDNIINTDINNLEDAHKLIKKDYEKTIGNVEHKQLLDSFKILDIPRPKADDRRTFEYRQEKQLSLTPEDIAKRLEKERQYRQTPKYQAYVTAYRNNPENKKKHKELDKIYTRKNTEERGPRKNANETVRSKVVKKLAEHFKLDEDEVERILNVRKYAYLTEPELAVRFAYKTEYDRENARQKYKDKREAITRRRKELYHQKKDLNQSIDTLMDNGFFDDTHELIREEIMDDGNMLKDLEKNENLDDEDISFDIFDDHKGGKKKTQKRKKSKKSVKRRRKQ